MVKRGLAVCLALILMLGPLALADFSGGAGMQGPEVTVRVVHHYTGELLSESAIGRSRWGGSLWTHLQEVGVDFDPDGWLIAEWYRNNTKYSGNSAIPVTDDLGSIPLSDGDVLLFSVFEEDGYLAIVQHFVNTKGESIAGPLCDGFDYLFDPAGMGYTNDISLDLDGLAELELEPEGHNWLYSKYKMRTMDDYQLCYDRTITICPVTSDIDVIHVYSLDGGEENHEQSLTVTSTYVDAMGVPVAEGQSTTVTGVVGTLRYSEAAPELDGYVYQGYRIDDGDIQSDLLITIDPLTDDVTIDFVYALDYNRNGVADECEQYRVDTAYVDHEGNSIVVGKSSTVDGAEQLLRISTKAEAIDGYAYQGYHIDDADLQDGEVATIDPLTSDMTIHFVYELEAVPEPPVSDSDEVITEEPNPDDLLLTTESIAYICGYPDGTVRPERAMSRGEIAMIVFRLIEADDKDLSYTTDVIDIYDDDWYCQAVVYLTHHGIMNAYLDGTFCPENDITRAELMQVISYFCEMQPGTISFTDVEDDHWAAAYIANAVGQGWVLGYPDGTFQPDAAVSRAEAVTVINRLLQREDGSVSHPPDVPNYSDLSNDHWAYAAIIAASRAF